jgi:acyl carrier protein
MFLTTALFNQMGHRPNILSSLKYMLFGGEAVDPQAVQRVLDQGKPRHLLNVYGPTEGTTFTTWYEVQNVEPGARTVPIGRPLANSDVWVLDSWGRMAPVGVMGELCIGGDGLARGYLGRPELTADRFVPHPYSRKPGARLYRTGDMVRYQSDGNIEFLKRIDQQVKIRGFRVELGEIESALNQYPPIAESVVVDRKDASNNTQLIAYVVPRPGAAPTSSQIFAFLQEKLPAYMIPAAFVTINELPLTPNGKVDKRALPLPDQSEVDREVNFVAPRTPMEETIAQIWREVLGLAQVGVESNFFDLGGHSLMATRVVSQIRERCGVELPLRLLFESPTIAALAEKLEQPESKETELARIMRLLNEMENLSEEEATTLLAQAKAQS